MAASFEKWFCEAYKNQRLTGPLAIHMRAAWNAAEQNLQQTTNKQSTPCPVCGHPCIIGGDDKEGTHYYIPQ